MLVANNPPWLLSGDSQAFASGPHWISAPPKKPFKAITDGIITCVRAACSLIRDYSLLVYFFAILNLIHYYNTVAMDMIGHFEDSRAKLDLLCS